MRYYLIVSLPCLLALVVLQQLQVVIVDLLTALSPVVTCALGLRHPADATADLKKVRYDRTEMVMSV